MTTFRNSYHFVPRAPNDAKAKGRTLPDKARDFGLRPGHEAEGHAIYAADAHSGRITCTVTLECPTIIGGQRLKGADNTSPARVAPFLFVGKPAIPASSLKGMLSVIAESAARAPYRVLRDMNLTVAYSKRDPEAGNALFTVRHQVLDGKASRNRPKLSAATQMQSSRAYFDPSLLPLEIKNRTVSRALVNPVESMFGFVAEAEKGQANAGRGKLVSAAGKLRFSHALPAGASADKETSEFFLKGNIDPKFDKVPDGVKLTLLKEQGAPMKPPKRVSNPPRPPQFPDKNYEELNSATPNFYFFEKNNPKAFISKKDFATKGPETYAAQGAKFYLHTSGTPVSQQWKSVAPATGTGVERKAAAAVLAPKNTFEFHIDFDNLTQHELNILCFALRPSERFRHKIGLGKGLGLGSICLEVTGLVLIDRNERYRADTLFAADPRAGSATGAESAKRFAKAHSDWLEENDKGAKRALLAIGETHRFCEGDPEPEPVLWVPLTEEKYQAAQRGGAEAEDESFEWFTNNDRSRAQKLPPIGDSGVPLLKTNSRPPKPPKTGANAGAARKPQQDSAGRAPAQAIRPETQRDPGERRGVLAWHVVPATGTVFGKVVDAQTGQRFHVILKHLQEAGLGAEDTGATVVFVPDKRPPKSGHDPAVWRIRKA
ncbi:hypothetical protein H9N28_16385 [Rhodobacter capsulatus]|uniref:RAMP superfamily CRISPR-associated protein n=1 Tax=Rhodobacter capsulatus TaxID=1061 RepID=UPI0006DCEAD0|nr:RAMP superfamily CRISPR-associated protein [Rhodobacter capsulatus]KQB14190.1 hypothetical protein AP073_15685 [Rhodobacter capsulatus]KQB14214.1 hypothetical protein AP071_15785 [Rhodobacter capsulatus]PZX22253.1 RAMP superfamily protein [Rhodobacter capsulatus]QNR63095.1 hypothetical protein H9N28_16385 [Rhodobacter capsulatus]